MGTRAQYHPSPAPSWVNSRKDIPGKISHYPQKNAMIFPWNHMFSMVKAPFFLIKTPFLAVQPACLMVKPPFLIVQSQLWRVQPPFLLLKPPCCAPVGHFSAFGAAPPKGGPSPPSPSGSEAWPNTPSRIGKTWWRIVHLRTSWPQKVFLLNHAKKSMLNLC